MRKILIPLATTAAMIGFASPASAQWFPQPQQYGYGYNSSDNVRSLQAGLNGLHRQIDMLASRNLLNRREAYLFHIDVAETEDILARSMRGGLSRREANLVRSEIARLGRRIEVEARNNTRWNRGYGEDLGYGSPYDY